MLNKSAYFDSHTERGIKRKKIGEEDDQNTAEVGKLK